MLHTCRVCSDCIADRTLYQDVRASVIYSHLVRILCENWTYHQYVLLVTVMLQCVSKATTPSKLLQVPLFT